jgi:hypothetical protein
MTSPPHAGNCCEMKIKIPADLCRRIRRYFACDPEGCDDSGTVSDASVRDYILRAVVEDLAALETSVVAGRLRACPRKKICVSLTAPRGTLHLRSGRERAPSQPLRTNPVMLAISIDAKNHPARM